MALGGHRNDKKATVGRTMSGVVAAPLGSTSHKEDMPLGTRGAVFGVVNLEA